MSAAGGRTAAVPAVTFKGGSMMVVIKFSRGIWSALSLTAAALLLAGPVHADVKAGVDAWSAGNYDAAVKQWRKLADKGDPDAQFNLAQAYKAGLGVERDLVKAEELYGKAAARGHLAAADNYGLLLFQRGERTKAMPYIHAAAERGDARAQYILGLAYFNADNVPKDWVRSYALVSLAQQAGLPQAAGALSQMDQFISLEERQRSVALASELAAKAETLRASQTASVSLGGNAPLPASAPTPGPKAPEAPTVATAQDAVNRAARIPNAATPATAGADYARPKTATPKVVPPVARILAEEGPQTTTAPKGGRATPKAAAAPVTRPASSGDWRVQLGAFGVASNADTLWNRLSKRTELAGHQKLLIRTGKLTRLQAGGFSSRQEAETACNSLKSDGISCLALKD